MKQFTKKNASQALTFSEVLIMEKAYTKLSLEQIQKELKKSIEEKEALYNKWNEVEHLTKKDGSEFKNISRSFSNCSIEYDCIGRPQITITTWTVKNVWCDDFISLYDSFSAYGKNKYPEESYNMGGGVLNKYHVLTISETMEAIENKKQQLKKCIEAKEKALKESEKLYYKYTEKMKALYNELHEECKCEENQTLFNNIKEAIENVNIWW